MSIENRKNERKSNISVLCNFWSKMEFLETLLLISENDSVYFDTESCRKNSSCKMVHPGNPLSSQGSLELPLTPFRSPTIGFEVFLDWQWPIANGSWSDSKIFACSGLVRIEDLPIGRWIYLYASFPTCPR